MTGKLYMTVVYRGGDSIFSGVYEKESVSRGVLTRLARRGCYGAVYEVELSDLTPLVERGRMETVIEGQERLF